MKRTGAALLVVLGWSLACATGGESVPNLAACHAYVDHMNTLTPCMGVSYDKDNLCANMEQVTVDMTDWWECLRTNAACDGTEPLLNLDKCEPPSYEDGA